MDGHTPRQLAISTHTPLARRDTHMPYVAGEWIPFLLTRLLRGVTRSCDALRTVISISTHTPLARRDLIQPPAAPVPTISTHTPLARRDGRQIMLKIIGADFYSHASCEA